MENEIKEVVVRPYNNRGEGFDGGETGGGDAIFEILRLHRFLLEQFGNELNFIADIIMAMDGRFDGIRDEMECRFQEEDYKIEVAFDELHKLQKRRRIIRG